MVRKLMAAPSGGRYGRQLCVTHHAGLAPSSAVPDGDLGSQPSRRRVECQGLRTGSKQQVRGDLGWPSIREGPSACAWNIVDQRCNHARRAPAPRRKACALGP